MKSQSDIIKIIEKILELKPGTLNEKNTAEEIESWDSMAHLAILINLDKLFDGKASEITELAEADSILKIINALKKNKLL